DQKRSPRPVAQHQSIRLENPLRDVPRKAGRGIGQDPKLWPNQIAAVNEIESARTQRLQGLGERLSGPWRTVATAGGERIRATGQQEKDQDQQDFRDSRRHLNRPPSRRRGGRRAGRSPVKRRGPPSSRERPGTFSPIPACEASNSLARG